MAEAQNNQEAQPQESSLDKASKDLKDLQVKEGDTREQITTKMDALKADKTQIKTQADGITDAKDDKLKAKLLHAQSELESRVQALETAFLTAPFTAPELSKKEIGKAEEDIKTKTQLEADITAQTARINDTTSTTEQKAAAVEARITTNEALTKLQSNEKRAKATETLRQYKETEEAARTKEQAENEKKTSEALGATTETAPAAAADKPTDATKTTDGTEEHETAQSLADRMDEIPLGLAKGIATPSPKNTSEKIGIPFKKFLLTVFIAMGSTDRHWAKDLSSNERTMLERRIGLQITNKPAPAVGAKGKDAIQGYKTEWKPELIDKDFVVPGPGIQAGLGAYAEANGLGKDNWIPSYDKIVSLVDDGKPTLKQVRDSLPTPPIEPADLALAELVKDLGSETTAGGLGVKDTASFFDALESKGNQLPRVKDAKAASAPEKASDAEKPMFIAAPALIKANPSLKSASSSVYYLTTYVETQKMTAEEKVAHNIGLKNFTRSEDTLQKVFEAAQKPPNDADVIKASTEALAALAANDKLSAPTSQPTEGSSSSPTSVPAAEQAAPQPAATPTVAPTPTSAPTVAAAPSKPKLPEAA